MSIAGTIKMTARQYLALGEDPPGVRLELVDGEIAVSPSPRPDHAFTIVQLTSLLNTYIQQHALGQLFADMDTVFDEHNVRRPDLLYYQQSRLHLIELNVAFEAVPDLAIEVVSPTSGQMDRGDKFNLYRDRGVRHYWIVDPQRRLAEAYEWVDGNYVERAGGRDADMVRFPPFDGLEIDLATLWRPTISSQ